MNDGLSNEDERDQYFGLSLRELVHTFKWQTLVLLKAMLLQPKVPSSNPFSLTANTDRARCSSMDRIASESVKSSSPYYHSYLASAAVYKTALTLRWTDMPKR